MRGVVWCGCTQVLSDLFGLTPQQWAAGNNTSSSAAADPSLQPSQGGSLQVRHDVVWPGVHLTCAVCTHLLAAGVWLCGSGSFTAWGGLLHGLRDRARREGHKHI